MFCLEETYTLYIHGQNSELHTPSCYTEFQWLYLAASVIWGTNWDSFSLEASLKHETSLKPLPLDGWWSKSPLYLADKSCAPLAKDEPLILFVGPFGSNLLRCWLRSSFTVNPDWVLSECGRWASSFFKRLRARLSYLIASEGGLQPWLQELLPQKAKRLEQSIYFSHCESFYVKVTI